MQKKFANDWCEHDFVKFIRSVDTERAGVKGANVAQPDTTRVNQMTNMPMDST